MAQTPAYGEGMLAASEGMETERCPYEVGTMDHAQWLAGHYYVVITGDDGEDD